MIDLSFSLPWPPSTNHLYATFRGRRVKTKAARGYSEGCAVLLLAAGVPRLEVAEPVLLEIVAHQPDARRRDLSNLVKIAEDALVRHGLLADDRWVHELHVRWGESLAGGGLDVTVQSLK